MEFVTSFLINFVRVYKYVILARVLLSWMPKSRNTKVGRFVYDVTEPVLVRVRNILPRMGMLDFSVIIVYFLLSYLEGFLIRELATFF